MGLFSLFPRLLRGCAVCFAVVQTYKAAREAGPSAPQRVPFVPHFVHYLSPMFQRKPVTGNLTHPPEYSDGIPPLTDDFESERTERPPPPAFQCRLTIPV